MILLVPDVNIEGQFHAITTFLRTTDWLYLWQQLQIDVARFPEMGLESDASDLAVWLRLQERNAILVTANRNHNDDDSLEAAIRLHNHSRALPVITLSDSLRRDREYYEAAAIKLIDHAMNLENLRGAGRIYIP